MSKDIISVRGTYDLYGENIDKFNYVVDTFKKIVSNYCYEEFQTPIFEFAKLFSSNLGESSDIVNKELYSFKDRNGEELVLRPEGTVPITRAIASNGLLQNLPLKIFYQGAMFRYERPQKGRQRQFNQLGIEIIGTDSYNADVEAISIGWDFLSKLGLLKNTTLYINSLGDLESRMAYRRALIEYLERYKNDLSEDSKIRLEKNPLRILDSKDEGDKKILLEAPKLIKYLNKSSADFYYKVKLELTDLGIEFIHLNELVRGLDYYNHSVFEFVNSSLGSQSTVIAGGRYSGLFKKLGLSDQNCVGFGSGVERLILSLLDTPVKKSTVALIPLGERAEQVCKRFVSTLRDNDVAVDLWFEGNMKKRIKRANKIKAKYAIILGDNEIDGGVVLIKDLETGIQASVDQEKVVNYLQNRA